MRKGIHFGPPIGRRTFLGVAFGAGALFGGCDATPSAPTDIFLSASSINEDTGLSSVVATISANGNPASTFSIVADPDNKFNISGSNLILDGALNYESKTSHTVTIRADNGVGNPHEQEFTINVNDVVEGGNDVTLSAVSTQQFAVMDPIDLSAHTSSDDKVYCMDLPDGVEIMRDANRVFGAPTAAQSETIISVYVEAASGPDFWIYIPLTVTASADPTYNVSNVSELLALAEFGSGYTGPGCVINLTAGATIDIEGVKFFGRFTGLTSPMIIKSADPNDKATIANCEWIFAASGVDAGNVSFVDILATLDQDPAPRNPEDNLPFNGMFKDGSTVKVVACAWIRCTMESNVQPATSKVVPTESVHGIIFTRDTERIVVWDCTFTRLFNAVNVLGDDFLYGRCDVYEVWGDLHRATTGDVTGQARFALICDNALFNTTADGFQRHSDLFQLGGGKAGSRVDDLELRANVYSDTTLRELPTVSHQTFTSTRLLSANTALGQTTGVYYRVETDVAGSDITLPFPDPAVVGDGFEICVMKFSGDQDYKVTAERYGSELIGGVAADYDIAGSWNAVRFYTSGGNWLVHLHSTGVQGLLLQDDGGLVLMNRVLAWHCGGITGMQNANSNEVLAQNYTMEKCTFVHGQFSDVNGDGIVDKADGMQSVDQPWVWLRNPGENDVTVRDTVAGRIFMETGKNPAGGTLTQINNNTDQASASPEITKAFFVGEGRAEGSRLDIIRGMRIKKGSALDGTGIGAVGIGLADGSYDWINKRPRLPGSPNVVTAPIITDTGTSYTISTAAEFSAAVTPTIEWFVNDQAIDGETGSTLLSANVPSDGLIRVRVTGTSSLSPAIVESVNAISHVAAATAPAAIVPANWRAETGSGSQEVDIFIDQAPNDNGAAIDNYEYDIDGSDTWISLGTAVVGQVTITMAAPLSAYNLRLRAVNSQGEATASDIKGVTSAGDAPGAFELDDWDVRTGVGPNELEFEVYSLPGQGAAPIDDIEYDVNGNDVWTSLSGASVGVYSAVMPQPDTDYAIRLRAVNVIGPGDVGNSENAASNSAFAPPTWNTSLIDTANNSNDQRYNRATATLFGREFMELANEQQDVDTVKSTNMSRATKDALNAAGQFVYVMDISQRTDIQAIMVIRGLGDDSYNLTVAFNHSTDDWNATPPSALDHYGFIDVSDLYGETAGSGAVWRLYIVHTQADQGASPRMYIEAGSTSYDGYFRRMAAYRRNQFSASDATMRTEIAGLGV